MTLERIFNQFADAYWTNLSVNAKQLRQKQYDFLWPEQDTLVFVVVVLSCFYLKDKLTCLISRLYSVRK